MPILHHISTNSPTRGSDATKIAGSMSSSEVKLTVCQNLRLFRFSLRKNVYKISAPTFSVLTNFEF